MARFDTSGLDDLVSEMARMGELSGEVAERMVEESAKAIREEWKASAERHDLRDTGDMIESITYSPATTVMGSLLTRDIYPQGVDRKGTRNAEKAFILNYGSSRIQPTYWVDEADANSAEPVQATCEQIWNDFLAQHGS